MRITGGQHRGRPLASPEGKDTRPTSDRARQAIFNILNHAGWRSRNLLEEAHVLDAFAGTGALGIEALSQGAAHAVFMENTRVALAACHTNIERLDLDDKSLLLNTDATAPPPRPPHIAPRDLVFLDPPYGKDMGHKSLLALARQGWLAAGAVCVMEMAKKQPEELPAGFILHDTRAYGVAQVMFAEWQGDR